MSARSQLEMNLEKLLRKNMSDFGENHVSGNLVLEMLQKHIGRDGVQKLAYYIIEWSKEIWKEFEAQR